MHLKSTPVFSHCSHGWILHILCLVAEKRYVHVAQDQIQVQPENTTKRNGESKLNASSVERFVALGGRKKKKGTYPFLFGKYASISKKTFSLSLICVLMSVISSSSFSSHDCAHLQRKDKKWKSEEGEDEGSQWAMTWYLFWYVSEWHS